MDKPGEEKELDKLRKTIEEFRAKAERSGNNVETKSVNTTPQADTGYPTSESASWSSPSGFCAPNIASGRHYDVLSPNSTINKRVSSGSISSMSSHASHSSVSSASSSSSTNGDHKQLKKKRWLPLKSAFSRGSRSSQSSGVNEFDDFDDSGCMLSPTSARKFFHKTSSDGSVDQAPYHEMLQIIQEKDRKLTDVRLEALTSQHQLHQLRDQIAQMQHEMALLRKENERLQAINMTSETSGYGQLERNQFKLNSIPPSIGIDGSHSRDAQLTPVMLSLDCSNLHRLVSPGREEDGMQMKFIVRYPNPIPCPSQHSPPLEILIGSVPVPRKTNWEELDNMVAEILMEYCKCIDGEGRFGITPSSVSFYKVGEQTRVPGSQPPELLPCAFIVGNVNSVELSLKDASCGAVDLMALRNLISKELLQKYVNTLLQKKRVMLHGPSGTGKTSLAYSLANHLVSRERRQINKAGAVYVIDVKQKGEEGLKTYLDLMMTSPADAEQYAKPHVIIVENCYLLTSLSDSFPSSPEGDKSYPYVIGTTLRGQQKVNFELCDNFVWITCENSSPHVRDYLAKHLRRCVVENEVKGYEVSEDEYENMLRVVTWLPLCWHHVNRCLEEQSASDVTIGPRVFTSCPSEFYASCSWFVQVWNHVIAPYVIAAVRRIHQSQPRDPEARHWVDPTGWVIESFPWNASDMGCDNTLRLKRITNDDLDCPPVPPRHGLVPCRSTKPPPGHPMTVSKPRNAISDGRLDSSGNSRSNDTSKIKRQNSLKCHNEGRRDPPVPPMELMGVRDNKAPTTVWHRHNSPITSPTKSAIHAGGNRKVH